MTSMIEKKWTDLEKDKTVASGLLYKRFSADIKADIFVALRAPENIRCVGLLISSGARIDLGRWNKLKDIKLEIAPAEGEPDKKFLLILLLSRQHKDVFASLCQDLITRIEDIDEESTLLENLTERLARWQSLFEKLGRQGLSDELQRGLYGELYFLRKLLSASEDPLNCIGTWKGPEKAVQDFQHSDWALEVKTTHGKNHQKIYISSERQLDDSTIPEIYLYHLSLDVRSSHGETLNKIVDNIYKEISMNTMATNLLSMKLMEYGYFNAQRGLYEDRGYSIRQVNAYAVREGFPRITENMVPDGVGDVHYSIVLSESAAWAVEEETLLNKTGGMNNV